MKIKVLKWMGILITAVTAIAVILLTVIAVWVWISSARLQRQLAAVRAAGDPVSLADLAGKPIPPEENAATYLGQAWNDVNVACNELNDVFRSKTYRAGRPTEAELEVIRSSLNSHPDIFPLLERAAACRRYVPLLDYRLTPPPFAEACLSRLKEVRGAVRLLQTRAILLSSDGKHDEALATCILMFRLCRRLDHHPLLTGYLVSLACHSVGIDTTNKVLRGGPVSQQAHEGLEAELAQFGPVAAYQWALKTERAYGLDSFRSLPQRNNWLLAPLWSRDELLYLKSMDKQLLAATQPYRQFLSVNSKIKAQARLPGYALTLNMLPAIQATREARERTWAQMRCLRVFNSLEALGEDEVAVADVLSKLDLPDEAKTDPLTGKPLVVKKLPEGWVIYSVGVDMKDDGGQVAEFPHDFGVGPPAANDDEM